MFKDFFIDQVQKLVIEFGNKGFTMTQKKATQWYFYMKNIDEEVFEKTIDMVLMNMTFAPSMSDVLKCKDLVVGNLIATSKLTDEQKLELLKLERQQKAYLKQI